MNGTNFLLFVYFSAVKRLIASKIKVSVYIIYVCVLYVFIMHIYVNTHTRMYIFKKNFMFID